MAGASGSQVTLGPTVTLFVGGNNATTTFAGSIGEASVISPGQLIKEGTGQFTLTGANTYTGGTIVLGGVLTVSGSVQSPVTCSGGSSNLCSGSNSGSSSSSGSGSFFPDGPFSDSPPFNPDGDLVDNTIPQDPPPNGQGFPEDIPIID